MIWDIGEYGVLHPDPVPDGWSRMNDIPGIYSERAYYEITVGDIMHSQFTRQFPDKDREQGWRKIPADP
jgi:hypothetical protein